MWNFLKSLLGKSESGRQEPRVLGDLSPNEQQEFWEGLLRDPSGFWLDSQDEVVFVHGLFKMKGVGQKQESGEI